MTELFIEKSKLIHGDKYDYFKVDYIKSKVNVIITCKVHGDFLQTPNNHLRGANCNKCCVIANSEKKKITSHEFIKRCNEIHGDRYDYTKVDYIDANTKVIIICKEHGEFYKTPSKHTNAKQGCAKCSGYYIPTTDEFIENARLVHGDKYDYSKVDYKYSKEDVIIICKIHGDFLQRPGNHIKSKQGCPKCGGSCKSNTIEFIEKSIKIHSDIYDYSKVNYIDATTKIIISCKIHGDFEQKPYSHLNGHGCYMCCKNRKLNTIEFIEKAKLIIPQPYRQRCRWIDDIDDPSVETLEKMRFGSGYIIGNSTFSWWGAFLSYSPTPPTIAPTPWFIGLDNPRDLIPNEWMLINR